MKGERRPKGVGTVNKGKSEERREKTAARGPSYVTKGNVNKKMDYKGGGVGEWREL